MLGETRAGTQVYFRPLLSRAMPRFDYRKLKQSQNIVAQPFLGMKNPDVCLIWNVLKNLYRDHLKLIASRQPGIRCPRIKRLRINRDQKINKKRALIAAILSNQNIINYAEAGKLSRSSYATVKRVHRDLQYDGEPQIYEYNNQKTPQVLSEFDDSIASLQGTFATIADLRRQHPTCSRKWIGKQLHDEGYRWLKMRRERRIPKKNAPREEGVVDVICQVVQALVARQKTVVIYMDEAHFPLYQTSDKRWTQVDQAGDLVYNRRTADLTKLSVIAACSLESFVGMQVYKKDIVKEDFLFFVQKVLEKYDSQTRVVVLLDNATWHTSPKVTKSLAGRFLLFNMPGLFRINAIENAFSFVRSEFRKRPIVTTLEEEAKLLVNIFYHQDNLDRFVGIHKNHLRQMLLLLKINSPRLRSMKEDGLEEL